MQSHIYLLGNVATILAEGVSEEACAQLYFGHYPCNVMSCANPALHLFTIGEYQCEVCKDVRSLDNDSNFPSTLGTTFLRSFVEEYKYVTCMFYTLDTCIIVSLCNIL